MFAVVATSRSVLGSVARYYHYSRVVSGPPRVRISFPEKVAHGIVLFVGCSIIPAVVTAKIPEWAKEVTDEEEN